MSYALKKNGNVTDADVCLDAQEFGWKFITFENKRVLCPEWDTIENIERMHAIKKDLLKKCNCKKSRCSNGACSCFRGGKECTKLWTCLDCSNDNVGGVRFETKNSDNEDDETDEDTEEDDEEDLTELIDKDCQNIEFCNDDDLGLDFIYLEDVPDFETFVC